MVFLALTRQGFEDVLPVIGSTSGALWVAGGLLTESELEAFRSAGTSITNFTKSIDVADLLAIENAVETIRQHHLLESVWVESGSTS